MCYCKLIGLIVILFIANHADASPVSSMALEDADIANESNYENPASLAFYSHYEFGISCFNKYSIRELNLASLYTSFPLNAGNASTEFAYLGSTQYFNTYTAFSYGLPFCSWLGAGIVLKYRYYKIQELLQGRSSLEGDIGIIAIPGIHTRLAIIIHPVKMNEDNEISRFVTLGFTFIQKGEYLLASRIDITRSGTIHYSMGGEYQVNTFFILRSGVSLPNPQTFSLGIGINYNKLRLDMSFENHPCLGISTALGLTYFIR